MVGFTQHRSFLCACLTGALLVGQLAGCTSWRVASTPPAQFTAGSTELVRVVRRNGTEVTLREAQVRGDTLYGTPSPVPGQRLAIPLSDVRTIEVRQGDTAKTVGLVVGVTAAVAGALILWIVGTCALCSN